jgi:RimJ/RimL family protein N-acetyltransferase
MRFIRPPEKSLEAVISFLQQRLNRNQKLNNGTGFWAVVEKETNEVIGTILLSQLPNSEKLPI